MSKPIITERWNFDYGFAQAVGIHWRGENFVGVIPYRRIVKVGRLPRRPQDVFNMVDVWQPVPRWMRPWEVVG